MADELIDIVDKDGNALGFSKMKSRAHVDGDWHKSAHVWVMAKGRIVLQKRADFKDFFPGRFDVSCAGHVMSGESCEDAAIRELEEELGLKIKPNDLRLLFKRNQISEHKEKNLISREVMWIFFLNFKHGKEIKPSSPEVSEIRLFDPSELRSLLKSKPSMFVDDIPYFLDVITKIIDLDH